MKSCEHVTLKNLDRNKEILAQKGTEEAIANIDSKNLDSDMKFKMVKHPDQKKYMHYAL